MMIDFLDGNFASEDLLDKAASFLADFDAPDEENREMSSWLGNLLNAWD